MSWQHVRWGDGVDLSALVSGPGRVLREWTRHDCPNRLPAARDDVGVSAIMANRNKDRLCQRITRSDLYIS
jgi:hypothetical protein